MLFPTFVAQFKVFPSLAKPPRFHLRTSSLGGPRLNQVGLLCTLVICSVCLYFEILCAALVLTLNPMRAGNCHIHFLFHSLGQLAPGRHWHIECCALDPLLESLSLQVFLQGSLNHCSLITLLSFFWNLWWLQEMMIMFINTCDSLHTCLLHGLCQALGSALS